jgi:hypothetical protein
VEGLNAADVRQINEAIRAWPPDDIAWFRELLDKYPEEALAVARLALLLDAIVVSPDEGGVGADRSGAVVDGGVYGREGRAAEDDAGGAADDAA